MGLVLLGWLKYRRENNNFRPEERTVQVYPHQRVGDIVVIATVTGILGAKYFPISKNTMAGSNSGRIRWVIFSGLTIYGGLLLGAASVIWFASRKRSRSSGDAVAPALILAWYWSNRMSGGRRRRLGHL